MWKPLRTQLHLTEAAHALKYESDTLESAGLLAAWRIVQHARIPAQKE